MLAGKDAKNLLQHWSLSAYLMSVMDLTVRTRSSHALLLLLSSLIP